jgi:hypothetical protein
MLYMDVNGYPEGGVTVWLLNMKHCCMKISKNWPYRISLCFSPSNRRWRVSHLKPASQVQHSNRNYKVIDHQFWLFLEPIHLSLDSLCPLSSHVVFYLVVPFICSSFLANLNPVGLGLFLVKESISNHVVRLSTFLYVRSNSWLNFWIDYEIASKPWFISRNMVEMLNFNRSMRRCC